MQIVIDIPDKQYNEIKARLGAYTNEFLHSSEWLQGWRSEMEVAIHAGTPLPKGHGGLIDEYTLGEIIYSMYVNKKITNTKYNTFLEILDYVPTVIEVDKAVKNE